MHSVARVSNKYWNDLRKQQRIFGARFYRALLTLQKIVHDSLRRRQLLLTIIYSNILYFYILNFKVWCFHTIFIYYLSR
jgi:hypothetical protein